MLRQFDQLFSVSELPTIRGLMATSAFLDSYALSRQIDFDECIGLEATVEPRVTWPKKRLFGQVTRSV
jgi:hypothetical protein